MNGNQDFFGKLSEQHQKADKETQDSFKENRKTITKVAKSLGTKKPNPSVKYTIKPEQSEGYVDKETGEFVETKRIPAETASYAEAMKDPAKAEAIVKGYNMPKILEGRMARETIKKDTNISPEDMAKRYDSYTEDINDVVSMYKDMYKETPKTAKKVLSKHIESDDLLISAISDIMEEKGAYNRLGNELEQASSFLYDADEDTINKIRDHYHDMIKNHFFKKDILERKAEEDAKKKAEAEAKKEA